MNGRRRIETLRAHKPEHRPEHQGAQLHVSDTLVTLELQDGETIALSRLELEDALTGETT